MADDRPLLPLIGGGAFVGLQQAQQQAGAHPSLTGEWPAGISLQVPTGGLQGFLHPQTLTAAFPSFASASLPEAENGAPSRGSSHESGAQKDTVMETDTLNYLNKVKQQFGGDATVYNGFLEVMRQFKAQGIETQVVVERVSELFKGHDDLIKGFSSFLPSDYRAAQQAEAGKQRPAGEKNLAGGGSGAGRGGAKKQQPQPKFGSAFSFVSKIKSRFADRPEVYQTFLEILHKCKEESPTIDSVREEVAELFRGHEDLLQEFRHFLHEDQVKKQTSVRSLPRKDAGVGGKRRVRAGGGKEKEGAGGGGIDSVLMNKFKREFGATGQFSEFSKSLGMYVDGVWTGQEVIGVVESMMTTARLKDLMAKLKTVIGARDKALGTLSKMRIGDLDLSGCHKSGTSYKKLPKEYEDPRCSARTEWHNQVLNDRWVCVSSGSEDYSWSQFRRNEYEMSMFKCEDDRYELDMLIENTAGTVRALTTISDALGNNGARLPGSCQSMMRPQNVKVLKLIYGDHASELLENLDRAPKAAVGVVLQRVQLKHAEWSKARRDMNKIWREVYRQNYYKSLDHRSFYFKQVDKKSTSAKTFWQEATSAKRQAAFQPHATGRLCYRMAEGSVHSDILRVILAAAGGSEEGEGGQILRLFEHFVHVFLGLRERSKSHVSLFGDEETAGGDEGAKQADSAVEDMVDKVVEASSPEEGGDDGARQRKFPGRVRAATAVEGASGEVEGEEMPVDGDGVGGGGLEECEEGSWEKWQGPRKGINGFKHLTPVVPGGETVAGGGWEGGLMYGDIHVYVFWRLYQSLFDRLCMARRLSGTKSSEDQGASSKPQSSDRATGKEEAVGPSSLASKCVSEGKSDSPAVQGAQKASDDPMQEEEGAKPGDENGEAQRGKGGYKRFVSMLCDVVSGTMDSHNFEDECTVLLGAHSYQLFYLDTLVERLVKQAEGLMGMGKGKAGGGSKASGGGARFLSLYEYELSRPGGVKREVYECNAYGILSDGGFFAVWCDQATHTVAIELLEVKDALPRPPPAPAVAMVQQRFLAPSDRAPPAASETHRPAILKRNIRASPWGSDPLCEAAHKGVVEWGDLSHIVRTKADAIGYEEGTGDYMYRDHSCRSSSGGYQAAHRAKKLRAWQEKRLKAIPGEVSEEQKKRIAEARDAMVEMAVTAGLAGALQLAAQENEEAGCSGNMFDWGESEAGDGWTEPGRTRSLESLLTAAAEGEAGEVDGSPGKKKRRRNSVESLIASGGSADGDVGAGRGKRRAKAAAEEALERDRMEDDEGDEDGGGSKSEEEEDGGGGGEEHKVDGEDDNHEDDKEEGEDAGSKSDEEDGGEELEELENRGTLATAAAATDDRDSDDRHSDISDGGGMEIDEGEEEPGGDGDGVKEDD